MTMLVDVGINYRNSYDFGDSARLLAMMIAHNICQRYLPSASRSTSSEKNTD
jgi:predicted alternative tryptophan synthase beta-subunit